MPLCWLQNDSLNENILFSKIIFKPSSINSFEKRLLISSGCLADQNYTAVRPRSWGRIEYKLTTSKEASRASSGIPFGRKLRKSVSSPK